MTESTDSSYGGVTPSSAYELVRLEVNHPTFPGPVVFEGEAARMAPVTVEVQLNGVEGIAVEANRREDGAVVVSLTKTDRTLTFQTTYEEEHALLVEALLAHASVDVGIANAVANDVARGLDRIMASREGLEGAPPLFKPQWWNPATVG